MAKATTVRFSDEIYARLDQASARTGLPVNSIVVAACLEWMDRHTGNAGSLPMPAPNLAVLAPAPRWATLRRAVVAAAAGRGGPSLYPFERFTATAQGFLTSAQTEAQKKGLSYIGTEHLLLAAFALPESISARILSSLGIAEDAIRSTLEGVLTGKQPPGGSRIVPTTRVKKIIELAFQLQGAAGDPLVNTGHILLALVNEGEGIGAHVLKDAGATAERVEAAMEELTEPEA